MQRLARRRRLEEEARPRDVPCGRHVGDEELPQAEQRGAERAREDPPLRPGEADGKPRHRRRRRSPEEGVEDAVVVGRRRGRGGGEREVDVREARDGAEAELHHRHGAVAEAREAAELGEVAQLDGPERAAVHDELLHAGARRVDHQGVARAAAAQEVHHPQRRAAASAEHRVVRGHRGGRRRVLQDEPLQRGVPVQRRQRAVAQRQAAEARAVAAVVEEVVREGVRGQRGVARRRPEDDDVEVLDAPLPDGCVDHPVDGAGAVVGAEELEVERPGAPVASAGRVQDRGDAVEERARGAPVQAFDVRQQPALDVLGVGGAARPGSAEAVDGAEVARREHVGDGEPERREAAREARPAAGRLHPRRDRKIFSLDDGGKQLRTQVAEII